MSGIGGGAIGSSGRGIITVIPAGVKIKWVDVNGFAKVSFDENGNIRHRGKIGRTSRV